LVSVPNYIMDMLTALRRPGESFSNVIVKVAKEAQS
jgi:hypothetical protein